MSGAFDVTAKTSRRAGALLDYHIELLSRNGIKFEKSGDNNYRMTGLRGGEYEDISFQIGYESSKKFLSTTFNMCWSICISGVSFPDSFKAKINFRGLKQIDTAYFKIRPSTEDAETMLNRPELVNKIVEYARKVDIALIAISYNETTQTIEIKILPYAGSFLWIKFPPVFYPLKLREDEMSALYKLAIHIEKYIVKQIS